MFKSVLMHCVKTPYTLGGMEMCVQVCTDALCQDNTLLVAWRCVFKSVLMHCGKTHYTLGGMEMCVQVCIDVLCQDTLHSWWHGDVCSSLY